MTVFVQAVERNPAMVRRTSSQREPPHPLIITSTETIIREVLWEVAVGYDDSISELGLEFREGV